MRVVRAADAVTMPWKNGGGTTREYVVQRGAEPFEWRLSVAEVAQSGPFSTFVDIDRLLVLLSGAGMVLHTEGVATPLHHLAPHRFPGEQAVHAELVDGPTSDLNLFWRRDRWVAAARAMSVPCEVAAGEPTIVYVADGDVRVSTAEESVSLCTGDVVVLHHSPSRVEGDGHVVLFDLRPITTASQ